MKKIEWNYKKNSGFTLIELLAVILILGIIALIAIPTVNTVLNEARRGAFEASLNNISKKVEETCSLELISDKKLTSSYTINKGVSSPNLELKGDLPDGIILVDDRCNTIFGLHNNSYKGTKETIDDKVIIEKCDGKCIIDLTYSEPILNGAKPVLDQGMVPVNIDNDGTVKKANTYTKWYSYENKQWANVVLVNDDSRDEYLSATPGTIIDNSNIIGHFVWVPRFKYKISTGYTNTPSPIDIIFENKTTEKSTGDAKIDYFTHPGFTFGQNELNGIWVAKFETTGTENDPTVLPNEATYKFSSLATDYNMAESFSNYGINSNSHILKNTEWAATTYLSHSQYGIDKQIRINNNSNYITGCGANVENGSQVSTCEISYGSNIDNYPQSTTGNITGIFDMSGGVWEVVMGNYNDYISYSDFDVMPEDKYYDKYTITSYSSGCNTPNCKGHSLTETKSWYSDFGFNSSSSSPWIIRGANAAAGQFGGIFSYSSTSGSTKNDIGFRVSIGNV